MRIPIYHTLDEAIVDDDPRLEPLLVFRWCANFCEGMPGTGIKQKAGYSIKPLGPPKRAYYYPRRHFREDGKRRSESLARAVLRLLGEVVPAKHNVYHRNEDRLDCRRANLVISRRPPGGLYIPSWKRDRPPAAINAQARYLADHP
jgi:hypothetical protein